MPQNILLIQDDPSDAGVVCDTLLNRTDGCFHVDWVRSCVEGLERLGEEKQRGRRKEGIAAMMVDLFLRDSQGLETFDRLFRAAPLIPILILSASQDEGMAKLAVQRGAQDYLLKAHVDSYVLPKALHSMLERAAIAEALYEEKERAQVTLDCIGDAVMSTDTLGGVTYLNAAAERVTGWSREEAEGSRIDKVLRIIDATTREAVQPPIALAIRENRTVSLSPNCVLLRRDGVETAIEDSVAPIHNRLGEVTGAVIVFRDVSLARAHAQRTFHMAQHDGLTDLPNRAMFDDRLVQSIALAHRRRQQLALLFLDVDRFKHINDSLGHAIGDHLLQSVARRLLACVRKSDTVGRRGGDEFVILLPDVANLQGAAIIAEKILLALRAPHHIDAHDLHLTVSIGVVIYPDDAVDGEGLMKNADFAMYRAKDSGRDNYQLFSRV